MSLFINGVEVNTVIILIHHFSSQQVQSTLFEEFSDLVKLVALKAAPVLTVIDVTIHLNDASPATMTNFMNIVSG